MKKKIDLVEEESEHEESESSGDEREDEEPRINKIVWRVQRYSFLDSQRTITSK